MQITVKLDDLDFHKEMKISTTPKMKRKTINSVERFLEEWL